MESMQLARILVADDNPDFRKSVIRFLSLFPDMKIIAEAKNGHEVMQMIPTHDINVILMDASMPKLNGVDASRIIKKKHPEIQIILWSAFFESVSMDEARYSGADIVTTKSAAILDVVDLIREVRQSV